MDLVQEFEALLRSTVFEGLVDVPYDGAAFSRRIEKFAIAFSDLPVLDLLLVAHRVAREMREMTVRSSAEIAEAGDQILSALKATHAALEHLKNQPRRAGRSRKVKVKHKWLPLVTYGRLLRERGMKFDEAVSKVIEELENLDKGAYPVPESDEFLLKTFLKSFRKVPTRAPIRKHLKELWPDPAGP